MPQFYDLNWAIVGLGYWGPNLLRNAWELEGVQVKAMCDRDPEALAKQARRYPNVDGTQDFDDVLDDPAIDAVLLATPISTHHELGRRALEAGKHLFVEKPMASSVDECDDLINLAEERELVLMPGHTFVYSPPVVRIKEILSRGEVGRLHFGTSTRVNLGIHQSDASVVRDLGPHDFSILHYWFGEPSFVRAIARASLTDKLDVAFIDLGFPDHSLFHLEIAWLSPSKLRRTVLVGSKKMLVYDDTSTEQVRIYDSGADVIEPETFGEYQLSYRSGDIHSPRIDPAEPLHLELNDLADAIREGHAPRADPRMGRSVVRMIEATERSLEYNAAPVWLAAKSDDERHKPDRRRSVGGMPIRRLPDPRRSVGGMPIRRVPVS
jgi:predicted dehydrogenase